jgi:hypothetical protein
MSIRSPIRRIRSGCCARAATGHAANESHEFAPFHLIEQPSGGRTMQQTMYWLDYDAVALAVLVIGLGMIGLLALSI